MKCIIWCFWKKKFQNVFTQYAFITVMQPEREKYVMSLWYESQRYWTVEIKEQREADSKRKQGIYFNKSTEARK